jgi:hypothetical protein
MRTSSQSHASFFSKRFFHRVFIPYMKQPSIMNSHAYHMPLSYRNLNMTSNLILSFLRITSVLSLYLSLSTFSLPPILQSSYVYSYAPTKDILQNSCVFAFYKNPKYMTHLIYVFFLTRHFQFL